MTIKYVDGTYSIAGSVTSGIFIQGETMVQTSTYAVAIYGSGTGPIEVGYQTYPATADNYHTWVGRDSNAVFTPTGSPVANGSNANDGSIGSPWASAVYGLSQMPGNQAGNSLLLKRNSVFWEYPYITSWGTGDTPNRFTIGDYGTGAKPAFYESLNIPSGSLWAPAPGRTYTYRTPIDDSRYDIALAWTIENGSVTYDSEYGSYAWMGLNGLSFAPANHATQRPIRALGEVSITSPGSGYPANTTIYLQLHQDCSPTYNRTAVLQCSTNGDGQVTSITAITCRGCGYKNSSLLDISTIMHPYLNAVTSGSGCIISFTSAGGDQTDDEVLPVVDFWPGTAWLYDGYLYMHTMHTPAGWSTYLYPNDQNGVDLTVPGNDYWMIMSKSVIMPNSSGVAYVDFINLSGWRHTGQAFGFGNNNGNMPMQYCRLYNYESHYPHADGVNVYGQHNEVHNLQMWFQAEMAVAFIQQGDEPGLIDNAYNLVDGVVVHSTLSDDADRRNYNPAFTATGQLYSVLLMGMSKYNTARNITVNGNVQIPLYITGTTANIVGNTIKNFKFNGIANNYLIRDDCSNGTIIDRFDNSGYMNVATAYQLIKFTDCFSPTLTRSKFFISTIDTILMSVGSCSGIINITNNLFAGSAATKAGDVTAIIFTGAEVGQTYNINNNTFDFWSKALEYATDYAVNFKNNLVCNGNIVMFLPSGLNLETNNLLSDYNCGYLTTNWAVKGVSYTLAEWKDAQIISDRNSLVASVQPYETNTYRLRQVIAAASSCVGKGLTPAPTGVTHDFNWLKIPNGGKVDLGAFQVKRGSGG